MEKKDRSYEEIQNSIWNRWLGMFVFCMMLGTACLIGAVIMCWKDLYQIGISFELQPVAKSSGYYFLIAGILYYCAYWIWRGRNKRFKSGDHDVN
jgi:hypothetical protein